MDVIEETERCCRLDEALLGQVVHAVVVLLI